MSTLDDYCLKWQNHQPNFVTSLSSLLDTECLVDVTLTAEEKIIQAHKVILSACSTYFQKLFSLNPCQHPIVFLKDVKYDDLKCIVDFIYRGVVYVPKSKIDSVIKTAVSLGIKSLTNLTSQVPESRNDFEDDTIACKKRKLKRNIPTKSSTMGSSSATDEYAGSVDSGIDPKSTVQSFEQIIPNSSIMISNNSSSNDHIENASNRNIISIPSIEVPVSSPSFVVKKEESPIGVSVITGIKKRNKLFRQDKITLKNEPEDGSGDTGSENSRHIIRQSSDPTPTPRRYPYTVEENNPNNAEKPGKYLSVIPTHLPKQNSDSVLSMGRAESTDFSDPLNDVLSLQSKSDHCPTLRPGPALGCNFCWNTIDKQGRILRRKTKYHCPECKTNLCIVPCFQDYHSQKENEETGGKKSATSSSSTSKENYENPLGMTS